jgi:hypothetical protein
VYIRLTFRAEPNLKAWLQWCCDGLRIDPEHTTEFNEKCKSINVDRSKQALASRMTTKKLVDKFMVTEECRVLLAESTKWNAQMIRTVATVNEGLEILGPIR